MIFNIVTHLYKDYKLKSFRFSPHCIMLILNLTARSYTLVFTGVKKSNYGMMMRKDNALMGETIPASFHGELSPLR